MHVRYLLVFFFVGMMANVSPARAIECIASNADQKPVLLFQGSSLELNGGSREGLEKALREKINETGKFRAVLPDQFRYAQQQGLVDKCTPVFNANVQLSIDNSDPGRAFGLGGFVTKTQFNAEVTLTLVPSGVTLDEFVVQDKASTFIAGKEAEKALYRLFDNLVAEFVKRKEGWVKNKTPGF